MKVKHVLKQIEPHGWKFVSTKGDHHKYKKAGNPKSVVLPGGPNTELSPGVLAQVRRITEIDIR